LMRCSIDGSGIVHICAQQSNRIRAADFKNF